MQLTIYFRTLYFKGRVTVRITGWRVTHQLGRVIVPHWPGVTRRRVVRYLQSHSECGERRLGVQDDGREEDGDKFDGEEEDGKSRGRGL